MSRLTPSCTESRRSVRMRRSTTRSMRRMTDATTSFVCGTKRHSLGTTVYTHKTIQHQTAFVTTYKTQQQ